MQAVLMYLLDTNTVIDLFKKRGRVAERVLAAPPGDIALAPVVLFELEVGAALICRARGAPRGFPHQGEVGSS